MKKLLILIILGLSLIINNCKDKDEIIRHVDPELKAWGLYQKGTWWVYEEEKTKNIDSFWVDSVDFKYLYDDNFNKKKWEDIYCYFRSENIYEDYAFVISSYGKNVQLFRFKNFIPINSENSTLLNLPLKTGQRFASCDAFKWSEIDTIFNLLNVFGINFENVVKVYDMCNRAYKNQPTYFYTAKNIGIIRKEFPDINQIWNLKRFKIIQ